MILPVGHEIGPTRGCKFHSSVYRLAGEVHADYTRDDDTEGEKPLIIILHGEADPRATMFRSGSNSNVAQEQIRV